MRTFKIDGQLTLEDISTINEIAKKEQVELICDNTKGLSSEMIGSLDANVIMHVYGGLNPEKKKYDSEHYQQRVRYSPSELSSIIKVFEKIERKIDSSWNDLEKAMYVYKTLCEALVYEENEYNGRDAARNLLGLLSRKSVCAGISMIYKEAMDRLGIECEYQNMPSWHSWNILTIDGKSYGIELTQEIYNKRNNKCGFFFFCREGKDVFYGNENHDLSNDDDEKEFDVEELPTKELSTTLLRITHPKYKYAKIVSDGGYEHAKGIDELGIDNGVLYFKDCPQFSFVRSDGSSFLLLPSLIRNNKTKKFGYVEYDEDKHAIKVCSIFSDNNLIQSDGEYRDNIANILLAKERVSKCVDESNGYVGYMNPHNKTTYYNNSINVDDFIRHR